MPSRGPPPPSQQGPQRGGINLQVGKVQDRILQSSLIYENVLVIPLEAPTSPPTNKGYKVCREPQRFR